MDALEKHLFDITAVQLEESALRANLPLNHCVALNSFFEACRDYGELKVSFNDKYKRAEFVLGLTTIANGRMKQRFFDTSLSYNSILEGWKNCFRASPQALYESLYKLYDQIGHSIQSRDIHFFSSEELQWNNYFRDLSPKSTMKFMHIHFLEYFFKYHEGVLVPYDEKNPLEFHEPVLFENVLREFPLDKLRKAITSRMDGIYARVGPAPEYILEVSDEELDVGVYYPSERSMIDVFWGMYLHKLARAKGYPLHREDFSLKDFIMQGNSILRKLPFRD